VACGKGAAVVMSALPVASCTHPGVEPSHGEPDAVHWGYVSAGAPEHWGALSLDSAMCAEGRAQSPLDIEDPVASALAEGVTWRVLQTPRTVSAEQLATIRRVLTPNARPTQPIHDRQVRVSGRE
jgi:carbonic anhydrase